MAKTQKPRTKADAPDAKDIVNRVRVGTEMTYEQAAELLHDYGNAARKYTKYRTNPDFPALSEARRDYTKEERLLAMSEHYRGFKLGMEAVIAAMHGYDVRDRVIAEYDPKEKK